MSVLRALRFAPLFFLTACSTNQPTFSTAVPVLHGRVRGGQQPVTGSTIQLYTVGTTGDGSSATPLLNPAPKTDSNGNFNITGTYTCPSTSSLVYILATGGNPGLTPSINNQAISLMAALGPCGNLSASTFIHINEVTTVASVNPLAPFTTSPSAIGSSATDAATLASAFTLASEFADSSTGSVPGHGVPNGTTTPIATINIVADILASCVNSPGGTAGDLTTCGNLFSLTTPTGTSPAADTLTAALHLAVNPTLNTAALFNLSPPRAPFQPSLGVVPSDFSLGLVVNSGLQPSVSTLTFASSSIGSTSSAQSLDLTNNSSSPVALSTISINGIDGAEFAQTNDCPASLPAEATCTVQVTFAPSATGARIAVLSVANSSSNSPLLISLSGLATASVVVTSPQLVSTSPASVNVGSPDTTVVVAGSGFTSASIVYIYGFAQPTTFLSAQSISFILPAQYLTSSGSVSLIVRNPGYDSNTLALPVINPVPVLTSISPTSVTAGSPNFSLTLNGSGLSNNSTVLINSISHPVSSISDTTATIIVDATEVTAIGSLPVTVVNSGPGGGTSPPQQLQVIGAGNRLRTLNYPTIDLASDAVHNLIYASVSSASATSPNSILAINPLTGAVVTTQAMPSQPGQLAVTDDGSYLYVSLPSTGQISRLTLPSLKPDISWSLGTTSGGGPVSARDLETAPGKPHTVAVTSGTGLVDNLTIYDDGVARALIPTGSYSSASYDTVAWGKDATSLFGSMSMYSGGPEFIFTVNQNGATLSKTIPTAFSDFVSHLTFDNTSGRLYDGYGDVVDALTGSSVGQFTVQNTLTYEQNPFAIDSVHGKAFFLNSNDVDSTDGQGEDIQSFDLKSFSFINSIVVPGLSGARILQWGTSGLAVGGGNQIFLIDGSFVSPTGVSSPIGDYIATSPTLTSISPQIVSPGNRPVDIILSGGNFTQAAVVTWNGQTLPVTWQSTTQVTATIPASLLAQPLTAPVFVSNGPGTENSGGVPFAVLPDLGPNTQITAVNISGQDMVWDSSNNLLYVAVTDSRVNGNSIAVVDPSRAELQNVVYTGNQPSALGISDDGHYLYSGFQTAASVKRFTLPDLSLDLTIPLNSGSVSESFAGDVKVAPGQPQTIAVSMGSKNTEPRDAGGLAIFDNAVQRPSGLKFSSNDTYKLAWGKDATRLFAHSDPVFQPQVISVLSIDSTGIASASSASGLTNIGLRPHYDSGTDLVYSDGGRITNPADDTAAGVLESHGPMVPDSTLNRAFVLRLDSTSGQYVLDIFDLRRQTHLNSITIPGVLGYPTQLVRWGTEGIAFLTDSGGGTGLGMLYLLQGSDISGLSALPPGSIALSPANVPEGTAASTTITVTGTNFLPTSTVLVNGSARATTFLSATQLSFQLTAADQAFANFLSVVVTNSATGGSTSPASTLAVNNPAPTITSLGTQIVQVGFPDTTITISGSGFLPATIAQFNGKPLSTTFVSTTQLTAVLPSADLATTGKFAVTTFNPVPGGGNSAASTLEIDNPAPVISELRPTTLATGSPSPTVNILGTGFVSGTVVRVGASSRTITYLSPTLLSVLLTAADVASPGNISLVAVNPAPGGGTSAAASVAVNNGIPGPITFRPSAALQGATTPTSITIIGSNFTLGSVVQVNGSPRVTTYVSSTQLSFLLTVADQATATMLQIVAMNPSPGGGTSFAFLPVAAQTATPVISSVSPTQFVRGSGTGYLQVLGSGITENSVVQWNGTPLSTSYSPGFLLVTIPETLLAESGTASITVISATATPPLSNAISVSIVDPPVPALTSISPSNGPINTAFTATLTGSNFTTSSTVAVNGVVVPSTFVDSTQLMASVPAANIVPGNIDFTVVTPAPGGGTSAAIVYTAYIPIANNSMVYNPANHLFYLSIPSSAGAQYGNSVVSLDPVTGALGTPIFVGSEPNRLALTSDGRYLWVGLDGSSSVRKVDLVANTAGLQFSLPTSTSYTTPLKAAAIAAVPGQTDSVVVSANNNTFNAALAIYDSGVPRGSIISPYPSTGALSLQMDGTRSELYAGFEGSYQVFTYNSSGLTSKLSTNPGTVLQNYEDRIQVVGGRTYTDFGTAFDAESGSSVGTFVSGANNAIPIAIDPILGLAFILDSTVPYSLLPNRIQLFNLTNFASAGTAAIPINVEDNLSGPEDPALRLTRWGANGLAFRTGASIYAFRSNLVADLSASPADLGVSLTPSGPNVTGAQTTYVATISNAGPANASEIALTALLPSTGALVSATPSSGICSTGLNVVCSLGALAKGATATVNLTVSQLTAGTSTTAVQVSASQTDPNLTNNQAASTVTITGETYTVAPTLLSITPSAILAGSTDTTITIAGTGFASGTVIQLDGVALPTNIVSPTQLNAIVPAANLVLLGWHRITIFNPAPGGGASISLPLSVYSAIKAGANRILYDPFSRKIFATLGSAMASGNSIEALTPETGTFTTPVFVGSEPTNMAISGDGQMLYLLASGSSEIVRYNMLTQQPESNFAVSPSFGSNTATAVEFAVQFGSEDTLGVTQSVTKAVEIVDFDPVTHVGSARPTNTGYNCGISPQFLNAATLLVAGCNSALLQSYAVTPSGVGPLATSSSLLSALGSFKLVNGMAFTGDGAVADVSTQPARQLGVFPISFSQYTSSIVMPEPVLGRAYFIVSYDGVTYNSISPTGMAAFDTRTFLPANFVPLNINTIEETSPYTIVDVIRWGQDGLAALTSSGTIYLLSGPAVVPQLLQTNTPPVLNTDSSITLQHGSGNHVLALSGTNFLPGVAVTWNGTYRTTVLVDATHILIDIPAADLTSLGSASIVAANPGSTSSTSVTVTIN